MKRLLLTSLCCFLKIIVFSQTVLETEQSLKKAKHDTARVRLLLELSDLSEDIRVKTYAERALALIEKNYPTANDEEKKKYLSNKAFALNNIGYGYRTFMSDNKKAIELYERALVIYEQTGETEGLTDCITNLQNVYITTGNYEKARFYINKALAMQQAANDSSAISETYESLTFLFDMQGKSDSALYYAHQSLNIRERLGDKKLIAFSLDNLRLRYNSFCFKQLLTLRDAGLYRS